MSENIIDNKNIVWIDIAKFIGIFLVVFGHTLSPFGLLKNSTFFAHLWDFIYLFHMPLFFIIAGYLYKSKTKTDNYKKILYGLLIPYLIYQIIYLPFKAWHLLLVKPYLGYKILGIVTGAILGDASNTPISIPNCAPCWFIMTIIQLRLIFNNINLNIKNLFLLNIAAIFICKFLFINKINLYFCLDNTLMAIPYFTFGYILKSLAKKGLRVVGGGGGADNN